MEPVKENLKEFRFAELNKATKRFRKYMVIKGNDNGFTRTFYEGCINETTFAPSRTGITVSVMECYQDNSQTLQDWKVTKILRNYYFYLFDLIYVCFV